MPPPDHTIPAPASATASSDGSTLQLVHAHADGIGIAAFYTKVYNRLLVPLTTADQPQAPPELCAALKTITDQYVNQAGLPRAA